MKEHGENSSRVEEVALDILRYLRLHPQAKDTLDGIARWWVGEDEALVKDALNLLVQRGQLTEVQNHYCVRAKRLDSP